MAGLYLHIPFCKSACHYCNFHFATSVRYKPALVEAMVKEIELSASYLNEETINTIYFGGGTPSLLTIEELNQIMQAIRFHHPIKADAEITLEANPDDITEEKLTQWKLAGINRLSIGVQSFFDKDLEWMHRAHNSNDAKQCIELAKKYFSNITIDLIYGVPGLTDEEWKQNVQQAISLGIAHLSCYALTVESQTPLEKLIRENKKTDTDSDTQARQFLLLMQWMKEAGFRHYEISNFAIPGNESKHNSSYWNGEKYLGIGPSAHSFNLIERQWNIANNQKYIQHIQEGHIPFEKETLNPIQQLNEYVMTAIRTDSGIDLNRLHSQWKKVVEDEKKNPLIEHLGDHSWESFELIANDFVGKGKMIKQNNHYQLTTEGKLLADGIAADLFF
jgi:oxygen-independent coproporphyrinogen-3 oxidase